MKIYSFIVNLLLIGIALRGDDGCRGEGGCGVASVDKLSEYNYINATVNSNALTSGDAVFSESSFESIGSMSDNITVITIRLKYEDVQDNDTIRFIAGNTENYINIKTSYSGITKYFESWDAANRVYGFIKLGAVNNVYPTQYDFTGSFEVSIVSGADSIRVTSGALKVYHYEYAEEDGWSCGSGEEE